SRRIQVRKSECEEHLRLRIILQRLRQIPGFKISDEKRPSKIKIEGLAIFNRTGSNSQFRQAQQLDFPYALTRSKISIGRNRHFVATSSFVAPPTSANLLNTREILALTWINKLQYIYCNKEYDARRENPLPARGGRLAAR